MKRLVLFALAAFGCNSSTSSTTPPAQDVTQAMGDLHKYVLSTLLVPPDGRTYAIDLNGDGVVDNQLGRIFSILTAQDPNLNPQTKIDEAVQGGKAIILGTLQTTSLTMATNVGFSINKGQATTTKPKFDGTDTFQVDTSQMTATVFGKINGGKMQSNNPVYTMNPSTATLELPILGQSLVLKINGAHVQFTVESDGTLKNGELHGSIKNDDVQNSILPAVATLLQQKVSSGCGGGSGDGGMAAADGGTGMCDKTAMSILMFFDKGCPGMMNLANDGMIELCEVQTNAIIMNALAPDVQIFDANGNYAPNANNTKKDSLSLGIGFEAVGASFDTPSM